MGKRLGITSDGTNSFSKIRFAVPYLCDFKGTAIWCDGSDMCLRRGLEGLWTTRRDYYAIQVVKHDYKPSERKYVGTELEANNSAYPRKNWSSLILWDCGHSLNRILQPEFIRSASGSYLQRFGWLPDDRIGSLPTDWNHLVTEQPKTNTAALVHHTLGIPGFNHYKSVDYADEWHHNLKAALRGLQDASIESSSVARDPERHRISAPSNVGQS